MNKTNSIIIQRTNLWLSGGVGWAKQVKGIKRHNIAVIKNKSWRYKIQQREYSQY